MIFFFILISFQVYLLFHSKNRIWSQQKNKKKIIEKQKSNEVAAEPLLQRAWKWTKSVTALRHFFSLLHIGKILIWNRKRGTESKNKCFVTMWKSKERFIFWFRRLAVSFIDRFDFRFFFPTPVWTLESKTSEFAWPKMYEFIVSYNRKQIKKRIERESKYRRKSGTNIIDFVFSSVRKDKSGSSKM